MKEQKFFDINPDQLHKLEEIYSDEVSPDLISHVTNAILEEV